MPRRDHRHDDAVLRCGHRVACAVLLGPFGHRLDVSGHDLHGRRHLRCSLQPRLHPRRVVEHGARRHTQALHLAAGRRIFVRADCRSCLGGLGGLGRAGDKSQGPVSDSAPDLRPWSRFLGGVGRHLLVGVRLLERCDHKGLGRQLLLGPRYRNGGHSDDRVHGSGLRCRLQPRRRPGRALLRCWARRHWQRLDLLGGVPLGSDPGHRLLPAAERRGVWEQGHGCTCTGSICCI
mmetsp:Transcript_98061/g.256019  ORF Transcript_98061/g.256019 Transcript_98061/m.256019 type:complete len:234 (+) Transcript_98061:549-1250(+)